VVEIAASPSGQIDFAQDQDSVFPGGIRIAGHRFENAIRGVPSACRVELPSKPHVGSVGPVRWFVEIFDQGFACEIRDGGVAVEPYVFGVYILAMWIIYQCFVSIVV